MTTTVTDQRIGHGRRKTDLRITPDLIVGMVIEDLHPLLEHPDPEVRCLAAAAIHSVGRLVR